MYGEDKDFFYICAA